MRIFLSFAGEESRLAETLYRKLLAADYDVFYASDAIRASDEYDQRIREEMAAADKLIFLASRASVAPGRYTLTEIGMAARKWPDPTGRVMTVLVDDVSYDDLPPYLSSVTSAYRAQGNVASEVTAVVVDRWPVRRKRRWVRHLVTLLLLGGVGFGAYTMWNQRESPPPSSESAASRLATYEVTLSTLRVHSDGDDFTDGDGDFFWNLEVNGKLLTHRPRSSVMELGVGAQTKLGAVQRIELEEDQDLRLEGHVTDKDGGTSGGDDVVTIDKVLAKDGPGTLRARASNGDPEIELFYSVRRLP